MQVAGSVALVTGSSRGIGSEVARRLHAGGARVILHGRDEVALQRLGDELSAPVLAVDLTEPGALPGLAFDATAVFGRIDVLVHSAGLGSYGPFAELAPERLDALLDLNLRVPAQLTRAVLPAMIAHGSGAISFLASIAGLTGVPGEAGYAASKFGVVGLAESLREELGPHGIEVTAVCPGAVATDFFTGRGAAYERRFPRILRAERVAEAVVAAIVHNRGRTVLPRWLAAAPAVRAVSPAGYERLARRFG